MISSELKTKVLLHGKKLHGRKKAKHKIKEYQNRFLHLFFFTSIHHYCLPSLMMFLCVDCQVLSVKINVFSFQIVLHSTLQCFRFYINCNSCSSFECHWYINQCFINFFAVFAKFLMVENEFTMADIFSIGIIKV